MGERTDRAWAFMVASAAVLRQSPQLLLLPVLSAISVVATLGVFFVAAVAAGSGSHFLDFFAHRSMSSVTYLRPVDVALLVGAIVATQCVGTFFNATLAAAVIHRDVDGRADVRGALRFILARADRIFAWACFASSVLLLTTLIRHKGGVVGAVVAFFTDLAWAVASFFAIPLLVAEDIGPWEALRRSTALFKRTWGERIVAGFSYGLFVLGAAVAIGAMSVMVGVALGVMAGVAMAVAMFGILVVVLSTLSAIFNVALFRWANDGILLAGFESADMSEAYQPKKKRKDTD